MSFFRFQCIIKLTIDNTKNEINCKYIAGSKNVEIINHGNITELKLNNKLITDINQLNQADKIIENLISISRINGDFGLEDSLINGKLALLNARYQNDQIDFNYNKNQLKDLEEIFKNLQNK